jgi:disulfide bond formation protein DsbB
MNFGTVTSSLAILSLLSAGLGLLLLALLLVPAGRRRLALELGGQTRIILGSAFAVATVASMGSLYYSDVVGFVPCLLCWYQRIAMYPLVPILGIAALRGDRSVRWYGLPLAVVGLGIALYHVVIQFQPALDAGMCSAAAPCSARYLSVFGFVSLPVMAASGFILIAGLLWAAGLQGSSESSA